MEISKLIQTVEEKKKENQKLQGELEIYRSENEHLKNSL
jgi:predicted RNase H-like nuclease (RuvC/YqgF family)